MREVCRFLLSMPAWYLIMESNNWTISEAHVSGKCVCVCSTISRHFIIGSYVTINEWATQHFFFLLVSNTNKFGLLSKKHSDNAFWRSKRKPDNRYCFDVGNNGSNLYMNYIAQCTYNVYSDFYAVIHALQLLAVSFSVFEIIILYEKMEHVNNKKK